ncbi:phosphatase PAP2 family protein [Candidatus Wolfebacteria bacterium]|nr:phosphatase PAP2 family protein [Candidatus Wolfebacteria bacterium]
MSVHVHRHRLCILLFNLTSLILFLVLLVAVSGEHTRLFDIEVYERVRELWQPAWILAATIVTHLFSWFAIIPTLALLAIVLLWRRRAGAVFVLLGASALGYLTEFVTKTALRAPRPPVALVDVSSVWSFPSGHTIAATIIFGVLIYVLASSRPRPFLHTLYTGLCILGALAVAGSRVYLGAHWLSDVLAGVAVGVFWLTLCILLAQKGRGLIVRGERFGRGVSEMFSKKD